LFGARREGAESKRGRKGEGENTTEEGKVRGIKITGKE
jgi:hypothetical protein